MKDKNSKKDFTKTKFIAFEFKSSLVQSYSNDVV